MSRSKQKSRKDRTYRENIEAFLSCVEELRERPFIIDGLYEFQFNINVDKELGQLLYESDEGDQEHFRSFLLTFRKFILNDEPSNIDWILNVSRRFVKDNQDELKEVLDELKAVWKYRYRKGVVRIKTGDLDLKPEYVLDLWLNGQYFHTDNPEKSQQLKELLDNEIPYVKIQLLWTLPLLTDVILRIGAVVSKGLKDEAFDFSKTISG